MNEQTDMHNPDADKKTIGKGRKKNLICLITITGTRKKIFPWQNLSAV